MANKTQYRLITFTFPSLDIQAYWLELSNGGENWSPVISTMDWDYMQRYMWKAKIKPDPELAQEITE